MVNIFLEENFYNAERASDMTKKWLLILTECLPFDTKFLTVQYIINLFQNVSY